MAGISSQIGEIITMATEVSWTQQMTFYATDWRYSTSRTEGHMHVCHSRNVCYLGGSDNCTNNAWEASNKCFIHVSESQEKTPPFCIKYFLDLSWCWWCGLQVSSAYIPGSGTWMVLASNSDQTRCCLTIVLFMYACGQQPICILQTGVYLALSFSLWFSPRRWWRLDRYQ